MSQENVEVIRGGYEAFNRGEVESAITALGAPDFEFVPAGRVPGVEDVYRGAEGFRQFLRFFWGMFDDARVEVHEFLDAGDQVVARVTNHGRGKQSGARGSWTAWNVWTLREGKVVRLQAFLTEAEALEAVGLRE
jgi:ketosteroid isomerase-like protein